MKSSPQFRVKGLGGRKALAGEIPVRGAKNAALKALAASLLFRGPMDIKNVPDIEDIHRMSALLEGLGCDIEKRGRSLRIQAPSRLNTQLDPDISRRLRASIVLTGPLLARRGHVQFPHPGGCVIGERPIDVFLSGFQQMGARIRRHGDVYTFTAPSDGLKGARIFFRMPSVTGTETFMMAGIRARGTTIIRNAAMEPEIKHLAHFLNRAGAHIEGAGTPTIRVKGGRLLRADTEGYTIPPDRIETGSLLILAALAGRDVRITRTKPEAVEALISALEWAGVSIEKNANDLRVRNTSRQNTQPLHIKTHEYPGFPTDLQAPMTVFLTQVSGESTVFETIFEGRLKYIDELVRMGADIVPMDQHRILIRGPRDLRGREMESPDLRAGLAFLIASIVAKGRSTIHNGYNIDRGYERIEERLRGIGVDIERAGSQ